MTRPLADAAREDDRLDEAAPLLGFGGSGAP